MSQNSKRQPNRKSSALARFFGGLILALGILIGGSLLLIGIAYFGLKPVVVWEYGTGIPEISVFAPGKAASYVDTLPQKPEIGLHTVRIEVNGWERPVWLYVEDTTAPTATAREQTVSTKTVLKPTELIDHLTDADKVWVDFLEIPPFGTVGDFPVTIVLQDVSGNRSEVESALHVRRVKDTGLTVEAGDEAPQADDFLTDAYGATLLTVIDETMLRTPGTYPIEIAADGVTVQSTLTVVDTKAPDVETHMLFREPGATVLPEEFCERIEDACDVTVAYLVAPDPDERSFQQVTIRVTDAAGNVTDATAGLLFTHATPVVVEARNTSLTAEECLEDAEYTGAVLVRDFVPDTTGLFAVTLYVDGAPEIALVEVQDTVAPVVQTKPFQWYLDHPIDAARLCTVTDATATEAFYVSEVDWRAANQEVTILVRDAGGNETEATLSLSLIADLEPPALYGVQDRYFYLDEPYAYLTGVTAVDNADGLVEVTVDTSAVTPNKTGSYRVTYFASDSVGNSISRIVTITVKKSTTNTKKLDKYVKKVADRIFTDKMSLADKVTAIYEYVFDNIHYVAKSDKTDWKKEALRGLTTGKGDCFTANCVARALLESVGAETYPIRRYKGNGNHYWLLVNIGTGWYHFDAHNSWEHGYQCCMWTDAQCSVMSAYWRYDKTTCPAVATEPFSKSAAQAVEKEWLQSHQNGE
ncbi:MAG: transglutaminase domain-containing protein [Clostridia bacterium]|nr:transglutaminase domain-containing protein [Clostridia bacterium]